MPLFSEPLISENFSALFLLPTVENHAREQSDDDGLVSDICDEVFSGGARKMNAAQLCSCAYVPGNFDRPPRSFAQARIVKVSLSLMRALFSPPLSLSLSLSLYSAEATLARLLRGPALRRWIEERNCSRAVAAAMYVCMCVLAGWSIHGWERERERERERGGEREKEG